MSTLRCVKFLGVGLLALVATSQSSAFATNVPVTFDSYATAGLLSQDGWTGGSGAQITVDATSPIVGTKSARLAGNSGTPYAISGNLSVQVPDVVSWLVRVDNFGTGTANEAGFESGLFNNSSTQSTVVFHQDGTLRYWVTVGGLTAFSGNPTYSLGTVYRVEMTDINITGTTGNYDFSVYNQVSNALVASASNLPLQNPWGANTKFYAQMRTNPSAIAFLDNINAAVVPEPAGLAMAMLGFVGVLLNSRRSRQ